jgi:hypothetical protein
MFNLLSLLKQKQPAPGQAVNYLIHLKINPWLPYGGSNHVRFKGLGLVLLSRKKQSA